MSQEQSLITYRRLQKPRSGSRNELRRDFRVRRVTKTSFPWLLVFCLFDTNFCYLASCHHLPSAGCTGVFHHTHPNSCHFVCSYFETGYYPVVQAGHKFIAILPIELPGHTDMWHMPSSMVLKHRIRSPAEDALHLGSDAYLDSEQLMST